MRYCEKHDRFCSIFTCDMSECECNSSGTRMKNNHRFTTRDEYGNADIKGVDMTFMSTLTYKEMVILTNALNKLADFEDSEDCI